MFKLSHGRASIFTCVLVSCPRVYLEQAEDLWSYYFSSMSSCLVATTLEDS